jgi:hypothetical protein
LPSAPIPFSIVMLVPLAPTNLSIILP